VAGSWPESQSRAVTVLGFAGSDAVLCESKKNSNHCPAGKVEKMPRPGIEPGIFSLTLSQLSYHGSFFMKNFVDFYIYCLHR
jgi:hypothetical protein